MEVREGGVYGWMDGCMKGWMERDIVDEKEFKKVVGETRKEKEENESEKSEVGIGRMAKKVEGTQKKRKIGI